MTRAVRSRTWSNEEIDFHLPMALDPKKKSDQLSSMLRVVVKRCMDLTFHDKFQVKKMFPESHNIRTKCIRGINLIMNMLPFPKLIRYN